MYKFYKVLIMLLLLSTGILAQTYTISGVVTSASSGEKLERANVIVKGTTMGVASDANGKYSILVPAGKYTIVCSYIGYQKVEKDVEVNKDLALDFSLKDYQYTLNVTVVADRAKERITPVAFTDVTKKQMQEQLGSQDIPMVLNTTPSVYATEQGGGAGDARINVRGFDQANTTIMINGLPVNDMENGWLYWSDWAGLGDVTQSLQVQRGLSAVSLATPSIGGTINIITDPAMQNFGINFKQEFGNDAFLKSTLIANSGLINGKFAFNATAVKSTGNGTVDKTWTDAWNFYFGASYNINDKNRLELYATAAPQRHGENGYAQNIAAYSHSYAASLSDYDQAAFSSFPQSHAGRLYNENWNTVNSSYKGKQFWDGSTHDRYNSNFINQSENYYNKPIVQLNWFSQLSDKWSLYTIGYWSGGNGGGSATRGYIKYDYTGPSRIPDWNATIANNEASTTGSQGILYNSVNNQWTVGAVAKAYYKVSDYFTASFGGDWRKASVDHFGEVRDLLGGSYYIDKNNEFDSPDQYNKVLGDKMYYFETSGINWLGFYGQGEYTKDKVTAYANYGWSQVQYSDKDHFHKDANGNMLYLSTKAIRGFQLKGGSSYRLNNNFDAFVNLGFVSKVPILGSVIDEINRVKNNNPINQKYSDYEAGLNFRTNDGRLSLKLNYYYTIWKDRTNKRNIADQNGNYSVILLTGINSLNSGLEFQGSWKPIKFIRIDASASFGNWKFTSDVNGQYIDYSGSTPTSVNYHYYIKDLKNGNAPQTQTAIVLSVMPVTSMTAQILWRYYADYYSDWDPTSRTTPGDRGQVWKVPSYNLFDFHFTYQLPLHLDRFGVQIFAHVFNVFDKLYVSDATDDSRYNAYRVNGDIVNPHQADAAEVFMGLPRTFNLGVRLSY